MTGQEWAALCSLIEEWWPGEFDTPTRDAWWVALAGVDAADALGALRACLARGQRFRPAVSEVIAELRADPERPTFAELYAAIYGRGGVLKAREPYSGPRLDPDASRKRAQTARLAAMHPLIGAFCHSYGVARLELLEVDDPVYGELRRKTLAEDWDTFLIANEGREIAAIAAGAAPGQRKLARANPLAELARLQPTSSEQP